VAFKTNEAGISRVYVLETATRQHLALSGLPDGVIGTLAWHPNSRDLAFTMSSPHSPSDAYSVDVQSGELTRWTESEMGGLVSSELPEPTVITWKSFDGLTITALYHKPPARFTGPRPVIINIHGGGPTGQSRPDFLGRANYFLNELGVAIISPNVRGSAGYGKTFLKLDNGAKRADAVKDVGSLLDWIGRQPELDASKVMVSGGSGGYMTLAVAKDYQDRIRAAMTLGVASETPDQSAAPLDAPSISSVLPLLQTSAAYRPDVRRVGSGDARDSAMRAFLDSTALLSDARRMNAASAAGSASLANMSPGSVVTPLFVVQGGNDPSVPLTQLEQMVDLAKQRGGPVWYLMSKDEGHGFRKKANVDFQFYAAVTFVREYLLGEAAP
jgi:dipeptidyl aminopeptidase/acylaminoacyl peptidase